MKEGLSVVMAIHNEEDVIGACIQSIYELADEIIVVDGKSTDKTVPIIKSIDKKNKIKIISVDNESNFHLMKQVAIGAASFEWTYQIDADEHFSNALGEEIRNIVENSNKIKQLGYWGPRLNHFLGGALRKGGQYPDKTLRFYRTSHGYLPAKDVHEQANITLTPMTAKNSKYIESNPNNIIQEPSEYISTLKSDLLHYPYRNFRMYLDKWIRYNKLEASRLEKSPNPIAYLLLKPFHWFLLAYLRHKGFVDGWPGLVFAFFSAIRFWGIWFEYKNMKVNNK